MSEDRANRIDEARWRRQDAAGVGIELADGQTWLFRRPVVTLRPTLVDGVPQFADRLEQDARLDAFVAAEPGSVDELNALLALALAMLAPNYDLRPEDLIRPLVWRDDAPTQAMWRKIADVALGVAPKAPPVG